MKSFIMKVSGIFILLTIALVLFQSCSKSQYNSSEGFTCMDNNFVIHKNDTTEIIYELLLYTVLKKDVEDFQLIKDKKRIFILNTFFKPNWSGQDTSAYSLFKNLNYIPYQVGDTRLCLKSYQELKTLANKEDDNLTTLQIGYITINADTAISGIQTYPIRSQKLTKNRVLMAGGGHHCRFEKVDGKWVYIGKVFGSWIS